MVRSIHSELGHMSLDDICTQPDSKDFPHHLEQPISKPGKEVPLPSQLDTTHYPGNDHSHSDFSFGFDTSAADSSVTTLPDLAIRPCNDQIGAPQTPQTQHIEQWETPNLESTLPSFTDSPLSPSSPEMPLSPVLPVSEVGNVRLALPELALSKYLSRQSSLRRANSARNRANQGKVGELSMGKQIGQGSFSQTFLAYSSSGAYAVKIRLPSTNPSLFAHERTVLETLEKRNQHDSAGSENVVKFYPELSETDHFVFKLYDSSLDEVVRSPQFQIDPNSMDIFDFRLMTQPLVGMENWVNWAQQLKDGLDFIHRQDIVHADIKPDNILISSSDNQLVIADFSGAIDINMQPASVLAKDLIEGFAWSPVYTDPQVRKQISLPSFGSDIYALGLVMAFMATGTEPYSMAKNATQRLLWMDRIKPLDSFDPDVMPKLSRVRSVIDLCLKRSFDGVDEALEKLRQELLVSKSQ